MKQNKLEPDAELDHIVCNWVQQFNDVVFRVEATHHYDKVTEDEFITVYDPVTDACITVWLSPHWYGLDVLNLAHGILTPQLKSANVPDDKLKGGA